MNFPIREDPAETALTVSDNISPEACFSDSPARFRSRPISKALRLTDISHQATDRKPLAPFQNEQNPSRKDYISRNKNAGVMI